ncbi:hypothetical protein ES703_109810 [subsurface metagenome]
MTNKMNVITRILIIPVIIILTGLVLAVPVSALLQLPHSFYGDIIIEGEPAPIGTVVEARCQGVTVPLGGNPIMTSEVGKYGSESGLGVKLIVQGEGIEGNPIISFYINGHLADQTYVWQTGEITRLDLSVTIPTTPENGGETSSAETSTLQCSLFGEERNVSISNTGEILESIEISSTLPSGKVTISINAGTKALDNDGNPLTNLTSDANLTPPQAPEDSTVYMACSFGPDGATFDPPIVLTFDYAPEDIPENTDEENLVIAFYDSSIGEWVPLASEVDTINHTITASVSHFTTFAILVPQVEPLTEETPPSTPPASDSEEPAPAITPEPAPAATPEPAPEEEPSVSQTPSASEEPESTTDWNLYIIIAAVIVGGIVIAFLIRWTILHDKGK